MPLNNKSTLVFCTGLVCLPFFVAGFVANVRLGSTKKGRSSDPPLTLAGTSFDVIDEVADVVEKKDGDTDILTVKEAKSRLLDLIPSMIGTKEDFNQVESYVNLLEDRYEPVQTLDFLNLAMSGEWQLLFSTNLSAGPRSNFRLREQFQRIETNSLDGIIANTAVWDLAEDGENFRSSGTFTVKCPYKINQGARMAVELEENVLELAKGSVVPKDVEGLVGLLHMTMPKELFDPSEHAIDTTFLDVDLRIVRMTGPRFEGVRDIFIRRGSIEVDPRQKG